MQRVTRSTAVAVMPAPPAGAGAPGYFTGGNPGTGTPATIPGYEWCNAVQEELMAVILAAGLTPSAVNHAQLLEAIQLLVSAGTIPTGAMLPFPATTAPAGWAKSNGIYVPRTGGWAALWAYAQASGNLVSDSEWLAGRPGSFSTGDGSTTFRIPDRRGLFDRGFHDGGTIHESNPAVLLGEFRDSQNKTHWHNSTHLGGSGQWSESGNDWNRMAWITDATTSEGGAEAFPRHTTSLWCIKL